MISQLDNQIQTLSVQREVPFSVPLALHVGWNPITLDLATGNYRVSDLDSTSADTRLLSFAANSVTLEACP